MSVFPFMIILISMKTELWKGIRGYEGTYQVSSLGNVRRITPTKANKEKIRKLNLFHAPNGYIRRAFWKDGKKKNYQVHRLVAEAFIPNHYPERIFVNHINHIKDDNRAENLEWVTSQMNADHATHYTTNDIIDHTINYVFDALKAKQPGEINRLAIRESLYGKSHSAV